MNYPIPCKVTAPNGDNYDSFLFGIFQFTDHNGSGPVAVVKLRNGRMRGVNLNSVQLTPATHFHTKDGKRVEVEENLTTQIT